MIRPFFLFVCIASLAAAEAPEKIRVPGGWYRAGLSPVALKSALALCARLGDPPESCRAKLPAPQGRRPARKIAAFLIDRLEVSQAQFKECAAAKACRPPSWDGCGYGDGEAPAPQEREALGRDSHPVVCVSFEQARAYCRWRGGDLPDEAQWEKAAGGGDRIFPWGDEWDPKRLNWGDPEGSQDGHALSAPVGSYPAGASPYGAQDMAGNVWEWTLRLAELDVPDQPDRQAIRGGGFAAAWHAQRLTKRVPYDPVRGYPNVGFRCVYVLPKARGVGPGKSL